MRDWVSNMVGCALVVIVVVSVFSGVATANLTIRQDITYNGTAGDGQAIMVNITLTPEVVNENITVSVGSTRDALIDTSTVSSPQPSAVKTGPREFEIDRLEPGQEVTITFSAYPKVLSEQNITAAVVNYESEQVPEGRTERVYANLSNSPLLELQDSQERNTALRNENEDLQRQIDDIDQWRTIGMGLAGFGVLVAFASAGGMYVWRNRSIEQERDDIYTRLIDRLDSLKQSEDYGYDSSREMAEGVCNDLLDKSLPPRHRPGSMEPETGTGTPGTGTRDDGGGSQDTDDGFGDDPDDGFGDNLDDDLGDLDDDFGDNPDDEI